MIFKHATLLLSLRHLSISSLDKISGLTVQNTVLHRKTETDLHLWERTT
jgi:hypothetical protein